MSQDCSDSSMPPTPKEKYKHFAKPPSAIDLIEISELTPLQCINMGISYCFDDDRYEDSFDEEFPDSSNCDTQPNSGNISNNNNFKKFKEDFKENKKDDNDLTENDYHNNNSNNKKVSKISKLLDDL